MPMKMKMRGPILALAAVLSGHPVTAATNFFDRFDEPTAVTDQDKAFFFCVRDLPDRISPGLTWDDLPGQIGPGSTWCAVKTAGAVDGYSYDDRKAAAGFCMFDNGWIRESDKTAADRIEADCLRQLKLKKIVKPPPPTARPPGVRLRLL